VFTNNSTGLHWQIFVYKWERSLCCHVLWDVGYRREQRIQQVSRHDVRVLGTAWSEHLNTEQRLLNADSSRCSVVSNVVTSCANEQQVPCPRLQKEVFLTKNWILKEITARRNNWSVSKRPEYKYTIPEEHADVPLRPEQDTFERYKFGIKYDDILFWHSVYCSKYWDLRVLHGRKQANVPFTLLCVHDPVLIS
jgi:hypothetical protein